MNGDQNRRGAIAGERGGEQPDEDRIERAPAVRGGRDFTHGVDYTCGTLNCFLPEANERAAADAAGAPSRPPVAIRNPVPPNASGFRTFGLMTRSCELC
jgi:hypothetical protein